MEQEQIRLYSTHKEDSEMRLGSKPKRQALEEYLADIWSQFPTRPVGQTKMDEAKGRCGQVTIMDLTARQTIRRRNLELA